MYSSLLIFFIFTLIQSVVYCWSL